MKILNRLRAVFRAADIEDTKRDLDDLKKNMANIAWVTDLVRKVGAIIDRMPEPTHKDCPFKKIKEELKKA
jgi:hypothetical protein